MCFYAPDPNKREEEIKNTFLYFKGKFPGISDDVLYERIKNGHHRGEGGGLTHSFVWGIKIWKSIFYEHCNAYTVFQSWDEYFKYDGDPRKHPNYKEPSFA